MVVTLFHQKKRLRAGSGSLELAPRVSSSFVVKDIFQVLFTLGDTM